MKPEDLVRELDRYGTANGDPALVAKYLRYFKEGYNAYGLSHEQVMGRTEALLALPEMTPEFLMALTPLLVATGRYEMTIIAFRLVQSRKKTWDVRYFETVETWFSAGIHNWAETDVICGELMNLFFKKGLVTTERLEPWRVAENKFQRRAAVVSLIKPMKLSTDFRPWFDFIEPMMHDPAREVHQGLGWFLREAWKKQPEITEEFLLRFRETAPRLIFQYATEKMTPEGKAKFRRSSSKRG